MPDLEKALDAVAYGIRAAECAGDRMGRSHVVIMKTDDLDNILELLKAQEPEQPEIIMINGNGIQSGSCPCCGESVNNYRNEKFCGKCGKRIGWLE